MSTQTAVKAMATLEKQRQALQEKKAKQSEVDRHLAATEQAIEKQKQVVYDAGKGEAVAALGELRKREMSLIDEFETISKQLQKLQDEAGQLAGEIDAATGPYRRFGDSHFGTGDAKHMSGLSYLTRRMSIDVGLFVKGARTRADNLGYGR